MSHQIAASELTSSLVTLSQESVSTAMTSLRPLERKILDVAMKILRNVELNIEESMFCEGREILSEAQAILKKLKTENGPRSWTTALSNFFHSIAPFQRFIPSHDDLISHVSLFRTDHEMNTATLADLKRQLIALQASPTQANIKNLRNTLDPHCKFHSLLIFDNPELYRSMVRLLDDAESQPALSPHQIATISLMINEIDLMQV